MTIKDAITAANARRQNQIQDDTMVGWLSSMDMQLVIDFLNKYHGAEKFGFRGYSMEDWESELIVPAPWDEIYIHYLCMRIDLENGDNSQYNADGNRFSAEEQKFKQHINRKFRRKSEYALRF